MESLPEHAPAAEPEVPAEPRVVEQSHPCRRCGYELRGLPVSGICPECGGQIARSLEGNLLAFANPEFLRSLAAGAVMVVVAIVLICAVPIAATLLRAMAGWTSDIIDGPNAPLYYGAASLATCLSGGLALFGWFALTARDPGFIGPDSSTKARLLTRMSTVLLALFFGIGAALVVLPLLVTVAPIFFWRYFYALPPVLTACLGVQVAASQAYLKHLALRIPDRKLRGDANAVRRVVLLLTVLVEIAFIGNGLLGRWTTMRVFVASRGTVGQVLSLVYMVILLGCVIFVLVRYADVLDRIRRHAVRLSRLSSIATAGADRDRILTALSPEPRENTLWP